MKISKKLREQAAHFCAALASTRCWMWADLIETIGVSTEACHLAGVARWRSMHAMEHGPGRRTSDDYAMAWAEAEAMLRCGWSPK